MIEKEWIIVLVNMIEEISLLCNGFKILCIGWVLFKVLSKKKNHGSLLINLNVFKNSQNPLKS